VVGWIAYRQITALEGDTPDTARFFERWKHKTMWGGSDVERRHSLVHAMRRVIARVRWWQRSKRQRRASTAAHLRPLDRIARSHVRWAIRHHGGTADSTLGLLRADVRQLLAAEAAHDATISRARQHLWAEMAAENIVALGRPGIWRKRQFKSAMHEPIPAIFCANPHNTIRLDGWATCADSAPAEEWANWSGPEWGDVKFRRKDVLNLWPPSEPASTAAIPIDRREPVASVGAASFSSSMQLDSGYISPLFVTSPELGIVELYDAYIFVLDKVKASDRWPIYSLLERCIVSSMSLLIVAGEVEHEMLATLVLNKRRSGLKVAAVKAPGSDERLAMVLDEIATFTGGMMVDENLGIRLEEVTLDMLGTAKKVVIEKNKTTIFDGGGKKIGAAGTASTEIQPNGFQRLPRMGGKEHAELASDKAGSGPPPHENHTGQLDRADQGTLRPFTRREAQALLAGLKVGGTLAERPTEQEARAVVGCHFATAPRDPVRMIVTNLWGAGKRGPKGKLPVAK
jgi:hypothetical protein